ncbi:MAG: response regulator [Patescibacteria group bacterium]|nr:response regulator [Patescibacteria group bacterium]MDD4304842.1 response regulator [Patescibacteria group bacterium]MDD4695821.1 response regulator [Patescibacteria group bacterium]
MPDKKTKVLIVEDETMLVNMYIAKFEKEGFETVQAENGKKGIEVAREEKPDIILLDIIMPEMDGFMVLKELKSTPETKNIPIIMLTNLGQEEDVEKGNKLGAIGYLVKANLTPSQVVDKVKEVLSKK